MDFARQVATVRANLLGREAGREDWNRSGGIFQMLMIGFLENLRSKREIADRLQRVF